MQLAYDYPMGPKLRDWLKAPEPSSTPEPSPESKEAFMDAVLSTASDRPIQDVDELCLMMDELLSMDMPLLVLKLADYHRHIWQGQVYRGLRAEGVASMLIGEMSRAESAFRAAHDLDPMEPAPYVNLIQILGQDHRFEEAWQWAHGALKVAPNHFPLWESLYALVFETEGEGQVANKIRELSQTANSWVGTSLFFELVPDQAPQVKAAMLAPFYDRGETSNDFLLEYTGALGAAGDFEQIPLVVWKAEHLDDSRPLSWQLYLHMLQAYLSMENLEGAKPVAEKLLDRQDVPESMKASIREQVFS